MRFRGRCWQVGKGLEGAVVAAILQVRNVSRGVQLTLVGVDGTI